MQASWSALSTLFDNFTFFAHRIGSQTWPGGAFGMNYIVAISWLCHSGGARAVPTVLQRYPDTRRVHPANYAAWCTDSSADSVSRSNRTYSRIPRGLGSLPTRNRRTLEYGLEDEQLTVETNHANI